MVAITHARRRAPLAGRSSRSRATSRSSRSSRARAASTSTTTEVRFLEEVAKIDVSPELLGRVLNGTGKPIDGGAPIIPEKRLDITGAPINPYTREQPADFIETGISRHRRAEHARPRPEAPDLLGLRSAGQRARRADHPPGARQVGRGVRHRVRRDGHHAPRGGVLHAASSRRRARSSASSSS